MNKKMKKNLIIAGVVLAVLIAAILRGREVKIPRGQDTIEVGDTVILVTREMGLSNVTDALLS